MAALSKILHNSCYEVGHTWEPSCLLASRDIARHGYTESFKIYLPVYLLTALLRRKGMDYYLYKLLPEVLQSSLFLGTNALGFIGTFCIWRKLVGWFFFFNVFPCAITGSAISICIERKDSQLFGCFTILNGFLPGLTSSYLAILLERKSRRGLLALYMSNIAGELLWNMGISRGIIKAIPYGEVYLFAAVCAVYMYLYRRPNGLDKSMNSGLGLLVGSSERGVQPVNRIDTANAAQARQEELETRETSASPTPSTLQDTNSGNHRQSSKHSTVLLQCKVLLTHYKAIVKHVIGKQRIMAAKHKSCNHSDGCIASTLYQGLKMFSLGYTLQTTMTVLSMFPRLFKKPSLIPRALFHKVNFQLAAFMGSFAAIFKAVNCALRWLLRGDHELYGLVSGFMAGLSMFWFRSSAITLYLGAKLVEILYFKGIAKGSLPYIRCADIIIYSISTALVFHAAVFEPHNIRPQYWGFLLRLTCGKFGMMNRHLIECYGTKASTMYKDFWPNYVPKYTDLKRADYM